jgi:hypothetical protein
MHDDASGCHVPQDRALLLRIKTELPDGPRGTFHWLEMTPAEEDEEEDL